jgi:predicted membrane protein
MSTANNSSSQRYGILAFWIVCVVLSASFLAAGQFTAHIRSDERDAWQYAYYADLILQGYTLYGDMWENKPPGIFWLNAVGNWLSPTGYGGAGLCALAGCATLVLFFTLSKRWFGNAAAGIGVVMASLYLSHPDYYGFSNRPETFVILFELAAVALYARHCARGGPSRSMFGVGFMAGMALLFKQKGVAALLAIALHQIYCAWKQRHPNPQPLGGLFFFGLGWLTVIIVTLLGIVVTADPAGAWNAIVEFNSAYKGRGLTVVPKWGLIRDQVHQLGLPLVLGGGTILWAITRRREARSENCRTPPPGMIVVLVTWLIGATYLAAIGPRPEDYYFILMFCPLLLLATAAVARVLSEVMSHASHFRMMACIGFAWMAWMASVPTVALAQWATLAELQLQDADRFNTADRIAAINHHSEPNDSILVWGFDPRVYWESRRPPATRFIGIDKIHALGTVAQFMVDEILADLQRQPPKIILMRFDHARKMAAGETRFDLNLQALGEFIIDRYRPAEDMSACLVLRVEAKRVP